MVNVEFDYVLDLVKYARVHGGFTLNVKHRRQRLAGDGGYVLSVGHCEMRLNACYSDPQVAVMLKAYINANLACLGVVGYHLGCWIDGGYVYFDVTQVVNSAEVACRLCEERCEIAFFDVDNQVSVTVAEYRMLQKRGVDLD